MSLDEPEPAPTDGNVVLRRWTMADLGCVRSVSEEGRIQEHTSIPERFTGENGRAWGRRQQERARSSQGWSLAIGDALTGEALGCIVLMLRPQAGSRRDRVLARPGGPQQRLRDQGRAFIE